VNWFRSVHTGFLSVVALALGVACRSGSTQQQSGAQSSAAKSVWNLTWSDEFDGPDGSAPDPTKWVVESGGSGWGNSELQYYTSRRENVRQEKGNLVIETIPEKFAGPDGIQHNYTSARLKTEGRFSQQYGRFEARIQVPSGRGLWPAFWLLGDNFATTGWPACGEINIMENVGKEPSAIQSNLHGPGYSGTNPLTAVFALPRGRFSDGFYVFAVEWEPQVVRFLMDGHVYATKTPADVPAGKPWVFDHPFFVILNLAVGGNLAGSPDDSTVLPQRMLVDYVRVYSAKSGTAFRLPPRDKRGVQETVAGANPC
jgi:beta-glucanase (GH16 family)